MPHPIHLMGTAFAVSGQGNVSVKKHGTQFEKIDKVILALQFVD